MSASISWRPLSESKPLSIATPSSFIKAMENAFGAHWPWKLSLTEHLQVLRGLEAAGIEVSDIIQHLFDFDEIEVDVEF